MKKELTHNFSLIDVVAIVFVLILGAALFVPKIIHDREMANRTKCIGNLKVIRTALALYSSEPYYNRFPDKGPMSALYNNGKGLLPCEGVFHCPSDPKIKRSSIGMGSYQRNGTIDSVGLDHGFKPNVITIGDGDRGDNAKDANHQAEAFVFLFKDGHGKIHKGDGENVSAIAVDGASGKEDVYDMNLTSNSKINRSWIGIRD